MPGARVPTATEAGLGQMKAQPLRTGGFDARASAADFGANTGAALANVGQGLQDSGQAAQRIAIQQQELRERADEIAVNKQATELRIGWQERLAKAQEEAPPGAPGFAEAQLADFRKERDELLKASAYGPRAKAALEQSLLGMEGSIAADARSFETSARRAFAIQQVQGGFDAAQSLVYLKPEAHDETLAQQVRLIDGMRLAEPDKAKLRQAITGSLAEAQWRRLAERDPRGSLATLEGGSDIPGLEYGDRLQLAAVAKSGIREIERDAEAARIRAAQAEERRLRVLGRRVDFAGKALGAGLTPEGLDELRRQVRGTELEGELAQSERMADFSSKIALAPLQDRVAAYEVERGRPVNDEGVLRLKAAGETIKADTEALKDGRGLERAAGLKLVELQPIDLSDPQSVAGRQAAVATASSHFGQAVGLLTPEERTAEVERIGKMTGEQRASYLASVQAAAGDAWPDVMRELGGKGGVDRKTQYLAVLSGRPEAATLANAVSDALDAKGEDLEQGLKAQGWTRADLDRQVQTKLGSFSTTLAGTYGQGGPGQAQFQADVADTVARTAMQLMLRGRAANDAIEEAASGLVNNRYEFRGNYRIPRPARDGDAYVARVEQGMADTMAALSPELLDPPGSMRDVPEDIRRETYLEHVRERGRWITLPDESGLALTDELGNVVMAKGRPVLVKFGTAP